MSSRNSTLKNKPEAWKVKGFMFCALLANSGVNFPGYFNSRETGIPLFPNRSPLTCSKCDQSFTDSCDIYQYILILNPVSKSISIFASGPYSISILISIYIDIEMFVKSIPIFCFRPSLNINTNINIYWYWTLWQNQYQYFLEPNFNINIDNIDNINIYCQYQYILPSSGHYSIHFWSLQ